MHGICSQVGVTGRIFSVALLQIYWSQEAITDMVDVYSLVFTWCSCDIVRYVGGVIRS